jgi:Xaa-Pro aminopeptidase
MFERLGALQARLAGDRLDALLVTQPANVFYLTGFRGTAGVVVLTPDGVCLITDSRYATVARALVDASVGPTLLTFVQVESSYEETIGAVLADSGASRVGIETAHMTVARYDWLERALHGSGVTLCRTTGLVESLRQVKDSDELATMRDAGRRISRVMTEMRASLRAGQREREVAADIDWAIRAAGFEGPAFETIVAAGLNTALPHARPGDRRLAAGDLVLLDFGGTLDGYCVDLTRVASLGRPDPAALGWHDAVSEAHGAALAAVGPGVSATEVDTAARAVLERRGLGPAFGHGTGHGLGLEVHEAPRVGKRRRAVASPGIPESNDDLEDVRLEAGMVFTVEPGVYLPGQGGVRLEDDLVVTETGYELLTHVSLDLLVV